RRSSSYRPIRRRAGTGGVLMSPRSLSSSSEVRAPRHRSARLLLSEGGDVVNLGAFEHGPRKRQLSHATRRASFDSAALRAASLRMNGRGGSRMKTRVIVNPTAGAGRAPERIAALAPRIEAAFGELEWRESRSADHVTELARECADRGDARVIVA